MLPLRHFADLRYGENPHQPGSIYVEDGAGPWWAGAKQLQGKEMSYNNYVDAEAAWRLVSDQGLRRDHQTHERCGAAYGEMWATRSSEHGRVTRFPRSAV